MNTVLVGKRLDRGLSRRDAAIRIGVTRGVLERAEQGDGVRPAHAKKIADFYGLTVTGIWPVDPPREPEQKKAAA